MSKYIDRCVYAFKMFLLEQVCWDFAGMEEKVYQTGDTDFSYQNKILNFWTSN